MIGLDEIAMVSGVFSVGGTMENSGAIGETGFKSGLKALSVS